MMAWPSFLPLALQLVQVLLHTDAPPMNFTAGQPLSGTISRSSLTEPATLVRPDQSEVRLSYESEEDSGRGIWSFAGADQRGIYRVMQAGETRATFAVNIDPIQSSLASIDPRAIDKFLDADGPVPRTTVSLPIQRKERVATYLIACVGALLVLESLLARSLGRRF
jgi:hypothetical protein